MRRHTTDIIQAVSDRTGVALNEMFSRSQKAPNVYARYLAMYFLFTKTRQTCNQVAAVFGLSYTMTLCARDKIESDLEIYEDVRKDVAAINRRLFTTGVAEHEAYTAARLRAGRFAA